MLFLRIVEALTGALVLFCLVTQVTIPLFTGRILFPAFRRSRRTLESQLAEQREQEELEALKSHINPSTENTDNGNNTAPGVGR
jgi:hypothetical protein